jgi:hypothetical protein
MITAGIALVVVMLFATFLFVIWADGNDDFWTR